MRHIFLLSALLFFAAAGARADVLVGIAHVDGLTGLNLEYMGEYTMYYGIVGSHTGTTGQENDDVRWQVGFRKRLERGLAASKGFYAGMVAGDLGGRKQFERLGAGGELGHQWVTPYTRTTISAGMAALEEVEEYGLDAEPHVFLGISWSLRK